jgi:hypothetical protein
LSVTVRAACLLRRWWEEEIRTVNAGKVMGRPVINKRILNIRAREYLAGS